MAERYFDGNFFKRKTTLDYFQCNCDGEAYLHVLLGIFSELAGDEGNAAGEDHMFFLKHGVVILLTRMSARINRIPKRGEEVIFTTWFRKAEGNFYLRDCEVRSERDELLLSLSGTWVLINLKTHRLEDASSHPGKGSKPHPERVADAPECRKIIPAGEMTILGTRETFYTDLDCNHHMNNIVYTKIATDFLPKEFRRRKVKDYVVNFNREVREGTVLELRGCETEEGYIIQGWSGDVLHFASEFTFIS